MRTRLYTALALFACLGVFISVCGCIDSFTNPSRTPSGPTVVTGHVFLDGKAVKVAAVEAVSVNGTAYQSDVTDDNGTYALKITPDTWFNVTATYQGLRHTIWPVYLPGEMDIFDINLTITPTSTIEGSGYTTITKSPYEEDKRYDIYYHKRWSGFFIEANSTKDNTTVAAITDNNGCYFLKVEPDVTYDLSGYVSASKGYPLAYFEYRNDGSISTGYNGYKIRVGPNETALVDYIIAMP